MEVGVTFTDSELLQKVANRDQHAFIILYDRYSSLVSRRAKFVLRSNLLAEEVLQDVMLVLWEKAQTLSNDTQIPAFLTTVTKNRCFEVLRRQVTQARANAEATKNWKASHNETQDSLMLAETRRMLNAGIDQLPPQQKAVYRLCKEEGMKYEDVARQLNLSVETVRSHMKHALRFLRNFMSEHTDIATLAVMLKIFF